MRSCGDKAAHLYVLINVILNALKLEFMLDYYYWAPDSHPVLVLSNLLHLEPLGTLALGHLSGDLEYKKNLFNSAQTQ